MKRYGIIGWPVRHSVSPQMQEAAFGATGIAASYEQIPVKPQELSRKIGLLRNEFDGWNVTVPHKTEIIGLLDEIEPTARAAGSVNTIVNRGGKLCGYSTDGYGLATSIKESFGLEISGHTFLFWGTGGAARAASAHFATAGAKSIVLVNRTHEKAIAIRDILAEIAPRCAVAAYSPEDRDNLEEIWSGVDVVIQSTTVGLDVNDPISIPSCLLLSKPINIVDMIYTRTKLIDESLKLGYRAVDGKGMLLYQGARSFTIWTGHDAPIEAMRDALNDALNH